MIASAITEIEIDLSTPNTDMRLKYLLCEGGPNSKNTLSPTVNSPIIPNPSTNKQAASIW